MSQRWPYNERQSGESLYWRGLELEDFQRMRQGIYPASISTSLTSYLQAPTSGLLVSIMTGEISSSLNTTKCIIIEIIVSEEALMWPCGLSVVPTTC